MLRAHYRDRLDVWSGTCSECLAPIPLTEGTRDEAEGKLRDLGWEVRNVNTIWCAECSSKARAPKLGLTQRGHRRRRP